MPDDSVITADDIKELFEQSILGPGGCYELGTTPRWLRYSANSGKHRYPIELFDESEDTSGLDMARDDFAILPLDRLFMDDRFTARVLDQIFCACVVPQLANEGAIFRDVFSYYQDMTIEAGYEIREDGKVTGIEYNVVSTPGDETAYD